MQYAVKDSDDSIAALSMTVKKKGVIGVSCSAEKSSLMCHIT